MILRDIVEKFGAREAGAASGLVPLGVVDLDGDQAVGISVGKGLHQDVFDNAKNGSGCADAEGEGDGGDYGKGGAFAEVAEREADILAERAHRVPPDCVERDLKAIRTPALRCSDTVAHQKRR